ncbi:hypothetical protein [Brevibacillus laterosporus]|uniref:hypothetical protein n=1 Tax=Brevibacillus laterosporus TaxID=1465 RepID=UPI0018F87AED|nr:hypothetical protein [Brevibacillus laterosporus]MBG9776181.1 hypothetical protein [Brevibacillus laterosporus]
MFTPTHTSKIRPFINQPDIIKHAQGYYFEEHSLFITKPSKQVGLCTIHHIPSGLVAGTINAWSMKDIEEASQSFGNKLKNNEGVQKYIIDFLENNNPVPPIKVFKPREKKYFNIRLVNKEIEEVTGTAYTIAGIKFFTHKISQTQYSISEYTTGARIYLGGKRKEVLEYTKDALSNPDKLKKFKERLENLIKKYGCINGESITSKEVETHNDIADNNNVGELENEPSQTVNLEVTNEPVLQTSNECKQPEEFYLYNHTFKTYSDAYNFAIKNDIKVSMIISNKASITNQQLQEYEWDYINNRYGMTYENIERYYKHLETIPITSESNERMTILKKLLRRYKARNEKEEQSLKEMIAT